MYNDAYAAAKLTMRAANMPKHKQPYSKKRRTIHVDTLRHYIFITILRQ